MDFSQQFPIVFASLNTGFLQTLRLFAITLIGAIREILGSGSIFGINIFGASFEPMLILVLASGGFLSYGILLGIINAITNRNRKAKLEKGEN